MFNFYFHNTDELRKKLEYLPKNHSPLTVFYEGKELVVRSKALGEDYRFVSLGPDYAAVNRIVRNFPLRMFFDFEDSD